MYVCVKLDPKYKQELVDLLKEFKEQRTKQHVYRLHTYWFVIEHFDCIGEPKEPDTVIAPYHNSQGAIVRKHVPIKFRY